ncbi:N-acetyltransferase [Jeotgalibaca sp. MA1X17-3]|uniref:GNAT family N-acetyltransferase n=1 Tax=Jeotgalibaca sp. MA1X17-3 TaxID=2908211 RepID=UPI001F4683C7|nr:GNAT family N-acetyltransferase [Jeotgalibaca sp. MA1X17-3]UJF15743.1 N-acetyltransferase [Jeotgalibaca sp. MA1X17-3]
MADEFVKHGNGYQKLDENGNMVAEITYAPYGEDKVIANHTYVDPSLRGGGVAEKMLDHLVYEMKSEGKKIIPQCSYVVAMFEGKPEKYGDIAAEK